MSLGSRLFPMLAEGSKAPKLTDGAAWVVGLLIKHNSDNGFRMTKRLGALSCKVVLSPAEGLCSPGYPRAKYDSIPHPTKCGERPRLIPPPAACSVQSFWSVSDCLESGI